MRGSRLLAGAVLACASITVERAQPREATPLPPPAFAKAPILPAGAAPDLDLVFTAQVAGYVEPCG
jgi:hypothetical protein